jgi:hypothetical protein
MKNGSAWPLAPAGLPGPPQAGQKEEVEAGAIGQTNWDLTPQNHSKILTIKDETPVQFEIIFSLTIQGWFNMLQNKKSGGKGKP